MASSPDNIDYDRTVNVAGLHAAAARERSATPIGTTPVSLWVVLATGVVTILAGGYLGRNTGSDLGAANLNGYNYTLQYPEGAGGGGAAMSDEELRQDVNWLAAGKAVYSGAGNCVGCHQASGEGVAGQFPPLKASEWVTGSDKRLVAILLYGIGGAFA
ncbi:MAG: c-type cytochrome, partial [Verrucomicrobiota bacterium]